MALTDNTRGAILMSLSMAAFTFNDTAMKSVTQSLPLFESIALRGTLATVGIFLLGWWMGGLRLSLPRRDWTVIGWRSLGEVFSTLFFLAALVHMPLANLSAIMQALPLAVTLAAALFLGETVGWRRMVAILIGFAGVVLIIRPGAEGFSIWSLMGLASVGFVVLRDLTTRGLSREVPSLTVALAGSVAVTAMGWTGVFWQGWVGPGMQDLASLAFAAVALIGGYLFSVMVMRVGDIGFVAPFRYTALLWAILLGWLVFGDLPDTLTLIGSALVVVTGVFTLWRERRVRLAAMKTP